MNLDKLIDTLEKKIMSMLSDEEVSATKIASLANVLLKLYQHEEKKEDESYYYEKKWGHNRCLLWRYHIFSTMVLPNPEHDSF